MSTSAFLSTRVPVELRNRLKAVAAKRGVTLQRLIHDAVEDFLKEAEREPPQLADVVARLRAHTPEMRRLGVSHLWVFGSVARGDADVDSDIDVAVDIDPDADVSLLDLVGVKLMTEEVLGWPTDLVERAAMKPRVRPEMEREAVQVF